jgi:3-phenylpropionate/trans-cinnamate dioxygenase ferredoxin reductase subunit
VVSEFYRHAHSRRGTTVRLNTSVVAIEGRFGRVTGVRVADDRLLSADLVIIGVGVVPRTELAEQLGLVCADGIVVDEFARTSDLSVVAAGDCTVIRHPLAAGGMVRLESMPNAVAQARVAAATLAGIPRRDAEVPWFWSDQYDLKLQIAGVAEGYDELAVHGDPETEKFSVWYYRRGQLLAVNAVNSPADYLAGRKSLASAAMAASAETPSCTGSQR